MPPKRSRKQRKKEKPRPAPAPASAPTAPPHAWVRASATLTHLELARGHDGLLRGCPEPAIIVALYRIAPASAALIARGIKRVPVSGSYPLNLPIAGDDPLAHCRARLRVDERIALLAFAIEEDAGSDVTSLYADLEDPALFRLWHAHEAEPRPVTLADLHASEPSAPAPARVHVIRRGLDLRDTFEADDFVGAALAVFPAATEVHDVLRFPFVSADQTNDWTAVLRVRCA